MTTGKSGEYYMYKSKKFKLKSQKEHFEVCEKEVDTHTVLPKGSQTSI